MKWLRTEHGVGSLILHYYWGTIAVEGRRLHDAGRWYAGRVPRLQSEATNEM